MGVPFIGPEILTLPWESTRGVFNPASFSGDDARSGMGECLSGFIDLRLSFRRCCSGDNLPMRPFAGAPR